ncbi:hypothetical protein SteCoe_23437 [Stentor coeruleus]|uniref:G domain-containing protein n=1 Tax=Stentor coeruleus TaxID=5963 RepID=A0A1R2BJU5_9CILI|nr:hypothetical protein SteCoe_23437 [Stentor coeruleus]
MDMSTNLPYAGAYILIGTSQSGKSSTINTISQKEIAKVGEGDGSSCTLKPKRYDIESEILNAKISLIDFPGFLDSDLKLSDEEILILLKAEILNLINDNNSLTGFIIFESVGRDSSQILCTLKKLCGLCGLDAKKSTLVIISKIDLEDTNTARSQHVIKNCTQQSIPYVKWINEINSVSSEFVNLQFASLLFILFSIEPFHSGILLNLENEIKQIAQKMCDNQHVATDKEIVDLAVAMSERSAKVPEIRIKSEIVNVYKDQYPTTVKNSGGFFGHLLGKTRTEIHHVKVKEQVVKTESYTEMVHITPQAFLELARTELAPKPVSYFMEKALAVKTEEIEQKLESISFAIE